MPDASNPKTNHLGRECLRKKERAIWRGFSIQFGSLLLMAFIVIFQWVL